MMMKGNTDMLTLRDINAVTKSKDGCIFSDLYKDVYGTRPSADYRFESIDAFDADFQYLSAKLDRKIEQEAAEQASNFLKFTARVAATMYLVKNATRESAIEIIAEAEGIRKEQFDFYGLEILENELNLKYGSIARWLSE
jgi:DNA primase large subunit